MRPTAGQSTAAAEQAEPQRRGPGERGFARRIECDGGGYYAAGPGTTRGGGRRDPSAWRDQRRDPRR